MKVYLVKIEVDVCDDNYETFILGIYSTEEKAYRAIKDFQDSNNLGFLENFDKAFTIDERVIDA